MTSTTNGWASWANYILLAIFFLLDGLQFLYIKNPIKLDFSKQEEEFPQARHRSKIWSDILFPLTSKADLHLLREIVVLHGLQFFIKMIIIIDTQTAHPEGEVARP
jgi:hypothetical protein